MGFGGLGIASSGMRAAQRNLNITGHNMANAEVQGFSRQRMIQKFAPSRSVGFDGANQLMQVGMGTDWTNVHQIRNEFLDINFRNNVSRLNFYSTVVQAGVQIETLLGELHGGYNFQTELNNIWYAIQELTSYPDGFHTRQFFLGNVTTFLTKAQEVFEGLFEYQQNLDAQIREVVNGPQGINATVAAIGELNDRIRFLELNGDMANDYRDQRNLLVDHLATLIPINVRHASNGDINITSLGHHILTGSSASPLGLRFIAPGSNLVEPVFTHERGILSAGTPPSEFTSFFNYRGPINSASGNDGGRLMALIHARGTSPKHHLSADVMPPLTIPALHDAIDAVYADVQAMMAADPALTFNDALNAALAEFEAENPGATTRDVQRFIPRVVQARFDANIALEDELILEMERDARAQAHNHAAHMWSVEHAKIPRAMMHLDRIVNTVATMINDALTGNLRGSDGNFLFFETDDPRGFPYGNPILAYERDAAGELILDEDGDPIPIMDPITGEQARVPIRPVDLTNPPHGGPGRPLFIRQTDLHLDSADRVWPLEPPQVPHLSTTVFSINNIRINPDFLLPGGHNFLALSLNLVVDGSSLAVGDTDLLTALQEVWMDPSSFYAVTVEGRRFNVQDAYIRLVGVVATETKAAASQVTTGTIQVDQAQNQRMSIKGVSMDEEMSAMLRFQFAFQASSRAFNMIDQMIDRIVNGTGRVGL